MAEGKLGNVMGNSWWNLGPLNGKKWRWRTRRAGYNWGPYCCAFMCKMLNLIKYHNLSPTTFEKARTAKCASGQSCEINSDLIFLRAIITRDQNPLSWLTAEWGRDKWLGSQQACPCSHSDPGPWLPGNGTWVRWSSEDGSSAHSVEETEEQHRPDLASMVRCGGFSPWHQIKTEKREVKAWLTEVVSGRQTECAKAALWKRAPGYGHLGQPSMHSRGQAQVHCSCSRKKA